MDKEKSPELMEVLRRITLENSKREKPLKNKNRVPCVLSGASYQLPLSYALTVGGGNLEAGLKITRDGLRSNGSDIEILYKDDLNG